MSYKKEYEVRLEDLGNGNLATDIAILKMLEEIAEQNSFEVGYGIENLSETNAAWLLLDWQVEIIKRPRYKEKINVETWSRKMERCYGFRDFEIYNKEKDLIVKGTSKWVLIDIEKRETTLKQFGGREFFDLPKEGELKPVFYIQLGGRLYFGFTPRLRLFYANTIKKGLNLKHKSEILDYSKALFGYANQTSSYKSRVSF